MGNGEPDKRKMICFCGDHEMIKDRTDHFGSLCGDLKTKADKKLTYTLFGLFIMVSLAVGGMTTAVGNRITTEMASLRVGFTQELGEIKTELARATEQRSNIAEKLEDFESRLNRLEYKDGTPKSKRKGEIHGY